MTIRSTIMATLGAMAVLFTLNCSGGSSSPTSPTSTTPVETTTITIASGGVVTPAAHQSGRGQSRDDHQQRLSCARHELGSAPRSHHVPGDQLGQHPAGAEYSIGRADHGTHVRLPRSQLARQPVAAGVDSDSVVRFALRLAALAQGCGFAASPLRVARRSARGISRMLPPAERPATCSRERSERRTCSGERSEPRTRSGEAANSQPATRANRLPAHLQTEPDDAALQDAGGLQVRRRREVRRAVAQLRALVEHVEDVDLSLQRASVPCRTTCRRSHRAD